VWACHTIYDPVDEIGADGIFECDFDNDGRLDNVSAFEQGGFVSLCFDASSGDGLTWSCVELLDIGSGPAWEDATCDDFDGDGHIDVAVAGQSGKVYIAFSPTGSRATKLVAGNWTNVEITAATGLQQWNQLRPGNVSGAGGSDLVIGGRVATPVRIAMLRNNGTPRTGSDWSIHNISTAIGVTMTIDVRDLDGDSDLDVFMTDRTVSPSSQWWANGGDGTSWAQHTILTSTPHKFMAQVVDFDGDGDLDVVGGSGDEQTITVARNVGGFTSFVQIPISYPSSFGAYHAPAVADFDEDGWMDIAVSASAATGSLHALRMIRGRNDMRGEKWVSYPVFDEIKLDNVIARDVNGDGHTDLLSTGQGDEADPDTAAGVFWCENPL
jgi:hypothetical protein